MFATILILVMMLSRKQNCFEILCKITYKLYRPLEVSRSLVEHDGVHEEKTVGKSCTEGLPWYLRKSRREIYKILNSVVTVVNSNNFKPKYESQVGML